MDEKQLSLFDNLIEPKAQPEKKQTITFERRQPKKRDEDCITEQGLRFDGSVPIEVIEISHPALKGKEASDYELIDTKVSHKLAMRPGSYVILQYRRPVVKHIPTQKLTAPPMPDNVLEKTMVDVSFLAGMLIDKFVYHMPLYRQHQKLQQSGITLNRASLTHWAGRAIDLLKPIADCQKENALLSKVLAMDETPIKAGRKQKGKMKTTYFWPIYGEQDEVVFTWSKNRGSSHVIKTLGNYTGTLLTDGYGAYDAYVKDRNKHQNAVILAQCWAHTRSYFVKAQEVEIQAVSEALALIGKLYEFEKLIKKKKITGQKKLTYRCEHSKPVVEKFFHWCREQRQRLDLTNSNPLAKVLVYVDNHLDQLKVFLENPEVPIDTNHLERALRVIPLGRKNWLFCWTELGAERVAVIQSLLVTCKMLGINPYHYLMDVLQRIDLHPNTQIIDLTPRVWKEKFSQQRFLSDLEIVEQNASK